VQEEAETNVDEMPNSDGKKEVNRSEVLFVANERLRVLFQKK